jgi:dihydrolipoamide dehydrogenase
MDFDVVIIGAGPGGYVAAIKAGQLGLKTALIEKDAFLGGTCLNVGCIPSKSLLQSSEHYFHATHQFKEHGIQFSGISFDFSQMQKRKEHVVTSFRSGLQALMKKNKVEVFHSLATFTQDHELTLADGRKISFKNAIISTGSTPMALPFLPFDEKLVLSSTGALSLQDVPKRFGVVGAGVIGVELGSVFSRLGAKVTVLEFLDKITPTCDEDISKSFQKILEEQGLTFHLKAKVTGAISKGSSLVVTYEKEGKVYEEEFDRLLVSVGRKPNTEKLGLESIQVACDSKGFIPVNNCFQTVKPHIYAIGDVIGQPMLAHKASDEGIACVLHIAGQKSTLQMISIPNVIYTDPEVAACGLTEQEAKQMNIPYKVATFPMKANSRAKASMTDQGFVKVIVHEKGFLIGAHLIASHAGELIQPLIIMIDQKIPIKKYEHIPHAHPTLVEAVKEAVLAAIHKPIHF